MKKADLAETQTATLTSKVEPTMREKAVAAAAAHGMTISAWVRALVEISVGWTEETTEAMAAEAKRRTAQIEETLNALAKQYQVLVRANVELEKAKAEYQRLRDEYINVKAAAEATKIGIRAYGKRTAGQAPAAVIAGKN